MNQNSIPPRIKKDALTRLFKRLKKSAFVYILVLFIVSRLFYMALGDQSIKLFDKYVPPSITGYSVKINFHPYIQMWYVWDAPNYGNLARQYSTSLSILHPSFEKNGKEGYYLLHWFPLYPLASKLLSALTHINIPYSQLLISNIAFIAALYMLYKLMRLDENDDFARTVVALLVLLPTSFLFSAALSEPLSLFLAIASLYYARRQRWIWAGIMGFFLALCHSQGFLIAIPLLVEAIQQYGFKTEQLKAYIKPIIACVLTASGLFLFMLYCWIRTKNLFAYVDSQYADTGLRLGNPLVFLYHNLLRFKTLVILGELLIVLTAWKKMRWSYSIYAFIWIILTIAIQSNTAGIGSSLRYISVVFPVAIAAGYLTRIKSLNNLVWISLGIFNGAFFILWANWWTKFIL
jgi:hypothetical protein